MECWRGAKGVVGEVWHRISVELGAYGIDGGQSGRATMVAHKQLLRNLTIMVKANNSTHGCEINLKKAIRVNAAHVTDGASRLSSMGSSQCSRGKSTTAILA
jgi:hypothetical protein